MTKKSENYSIHKAMQYDALLTAVLYDWNNNRVELGDRICVELPENQIRTNWHPDEHEYIYAAEKKIYGTLVMRLSDGIGLIVDKVESEDEEGDEMPITVGWHKLKYTKYKWYKHCS
jgi:hypothetical protein